MLAPASSLAVQPTLLESFAQLLLTARFEALTMLRTLMHANADDATPAAVLRERRLAATAILRVPCEPAKPAPTRCAPIEPPAHASAPCDPRAMPRGESQSPIAPMQVAAPRNPDPVPTFQPPAPAPAFKQRRGATPITSLRRRNGATEARAADSG